MSHITCPKCSSNNHYTGYGFAVGGLGGYTICQCGVVLEFKSDPENYVLEKMMEESDE